MSLTVENIKVRSALNILQYVPIATDPCGKYQYGVPNDSSDHQALGKIELVPSLFANQQQVAKGRKGKLQELGRQSITTLYMLIRNVRAIWRSRWAMCWRLNCALAVWISVSRRCSTWISACAASSATAPT